MKEKTVRNEGEKLRRKNKKVLKSEKAKREGLYQDQGHT